MTLTITIELDNAAFVDDGLDEVERILDDLVTRLPDPLSTTIGDYSLHDINGNYVGRARIDG